jgi:hypothetical protein
MGPPLIPGEAMSCITKHGITCEIFVIGKFRVADVMPPITVESVTQPFDSEP